MLTDILQIEDLFRAIELGAAAQYGLFYSCRALQCAIARYERNDPDMRHWLGSCLHDDVCGGAPLDNIGRYLQYMMLGDKFRYTEQIGLLMRYHCWSYFVKSLDKISTSIHVLRKMIVETDNIMAAQKLCDIMADLGEFTDINKVKLIALAAQYGRRAMICEIDPDLVAAQDAMWDVVRGKHHRAVKTLESLGVPRFEMPNISSRRQRRKVEQTTRCRQRTARRDDYYSI